MDKSVSLSVTTLAQYVRLESCDRYLWYRLHPKETRGLFRSFRLTEQRSRLDHGCDSRVRHALRSPRRGLRRHEPDLLR